MDFGTHSEGGAAAGPSASPTRVDDPRRIQNLGNRHNIKPQVISKAISQVPVLDKARNEKVINWPHLVVKTIKSILSERASLAGRLQKIAEITNGV